MKQPDKFGWRKGDLTLLKDDKVTPQDLDQILNNLEFEWLEE